MTILNSIQDLAKKITGKDVDGENISEVIDDFAKKYEGGISEVTNAIETHGLGWTETEEKAGFDITWDGNTEGLDYIQLGDGGFYKISSELYGMSSVEDLIDANILLYSGEGPIDVTITDADIMTEDNKVFIIYEDAMVIAFEDGAMGAFNFSKGIWFVKMNDSIYNHRFYKEATTEEVVHKIDEKYIPQGSGGGAVVVEFGIVGEDAFTATHTPQQVAEAMLLQPVIGVVKLDEMAMPLGSPWTNGFMFDKLYIYFGSHNTETYSAMAVWRGNVETNEWEPYAP